MMSENMQSGLIIAPFTDTLVHHVVALHISAFIGYMNTKLGRNYLASFFSWFQKNEDSIKMVAIQEDGNVIGYVVGAPLGYERQMGCDMFWISTISLILRPWLLLDPRVVNAVMNRGKRILRDPKSLEESLHLPSPTMSLVGIGVMPQYQFGGIGYRLMQAFEEKALGMHMKAMRLSVYPENILARRLYEKCGWKAHETSILPGKAMYYYKVLKR